jgi:peptide alpha-N-acetyltransferase
VQVALETETTNAAAIKLYERLGFLRSKRLHRYYFNGNSAFRLILYLKPFGSDGGRCGCMEGEGEHHHEHGHGHGHDHGVDDVS